MRDVGRFTASREIRVKIAGGEIGGTVGHESSRIIAISREGVAGSPSFDLIAFRGNGERKADTSRPR